MVNLTTLVAENTEVKQGSIKESENILFSSSSHSKVFILLTDKEINVHLEVASYCVRYWWWQHLIYASSQHQAVPGLAQLAK